MTLPSCRVRPLQQLALWTWLCLYAVACQGGSIDGGTNAAAPGEPAAVADNGAPGLYRLTVPQYGRALTAAFGGNVQVPVLAITDLSSGGFTATGAGLVGMPQVDAEAFTDAAQNVGAQLVATAARASYPCAPAAVQDKACATTLVSTYGAKLFRRPLSADQQQRYVTLALAQAANTNDFWLGMQAAFSAMLQSPYFLFRIDSVVGSGKNPNAFDSYTLASRLSFLLWDDVPDAELLAAAANNSLQDANVLATESNRMLQDPRANVGLMVFAGQMLQLTDILTAQKDANDMSNATKQDLLTQAQMSVQNWLLSDGADFRDLFTSTEVYVNSNLASRYGYPTPSDANFQKTVYMGNDRAGLFGLPGVTAMLAPSNRTSPTKRGQFVRQALLCTPVPSPPATVSTALPAAGTTALTLRQIMVQHAIDPACSVCHNLMDPMGFAMEDFDALGAYRTTDNGLPVDLTGTLDGAAFTDGRSFGAVLHDEAKMTACVVQRFLLHASGSAQSTDAPTNATLLANFATASYSLKGMVQAYVLSDAFTQAASL